MKRNTRLMVMAILLAGCVGFFTSCASNLVKNPQPPATVLNSDPVAAPDTKPQVVAATTASQPNLHSALARHASRKIHRGVVHASPVVLTAPAGSAPKTSPALAVVPSFVAMDSAVQPGATRKGNGWPWLLLLLLLLLLMELGRRLWARYQLEKQALAEDAEWRKRGIMAQIARLTHKAKLAKRARLAYRAKLAREAELAHEAKLARAASLVRKGIRAKVAALAHKLMMAKRARLARKAKMAGEALLAHEAQLAREKELAHQAKLARNARLAHKEKLAREVLLAREAKSAKEAELAHQAKLKRNAQLAHQEKLAKEARATQPIALSKGSVTVEQPGSKIAVPVAVEGIGVVGPEYLHPTASAQETVKTHGGSTQQPHSTQPETHFKGAGSVQKGILSKIAGFNPKVVLTEAPGIASLGVLAKDAGLTGDEILVQGPGMAEVVKVTVKTGATFQEIIVSVARMGNFSAQEAHVFIENAQFPLDPTHRMEAQHPRHLVHHVHTQKEIEVKAQFNGLERQKNFSPATTVRKILAWAVHDFMIPDQDGTEVYLSVAGSTVPMSDTTHLGRYVPHDQNKLVINVMTPARVIG